MNWLEELRNEWNRRYGEGDDSIVVTGGPRSEAGNELEADIRVCGKEELLRYAVILLDISDENDVYFDELSLLRKGDRMWLHLVVKGQNNRRIINLAQ
jgi:hypothetical protein